MKCDRCEIECTVHTEIEGRRFCWACGNLLYDMLHRFVNSGKEVARQRAKENDNPAAGGD